MIKRLCLCSVLTPFVHGGAEILVDLLEEKLRWRGFEVERVTLPFKWFPKEQILRDALAWRLMDVTGSYFHSVDRVICTKFPSYMVKHPSKVLWLFHQHREVYDFYGTSFSSFGEGHLDQSVRQMVFEMDNSAFSEAKKIYTISRNVAGRLQRYNGVHGTVLYPPPKNSERYRSEKFGNYVLSVGRLELNKRVALLIRAMAQVRGEIRAVIVGQGPQRESLERLAEKCGVAHRVEFLGFVEDERLLDLYSQAGMVYFAPIDEDYGFVTVEALLSERPIVTSSDSGGVLEFVEEGCGGLVAQEPCEEEIARLIERLAGDRALSQELGREGRKRVVPLNWDYVVDRLTSESEGIP